MTFSSRPLCTLAAIAPLAFAIAVIVGLGLVSSGCEDKHIGRVCNLDTAAATTSMSGTDATFNGQAVECPTRICVLPSMEGGATTTTALCTAGCSSDDDCSDGETTSDPNGKQCKKGFACLIASTVGPFCCEHVCVCKDFVDTTQPGFNKTPDSCQPKHSMCKNAQ
ncbi:MAG TPA: hypothetical protein VGK52_11130 [Polyangia bacterium]|jgi:hypothetical protein